MTPKGVRIIAKAINYVHLFRYINHVMFCVKNIYENIKQMRENVEN